MKAPAAWSAAIVACIAGGCADVDTNVLTKEQFVAAADRICADAATRAFAPPGGEDAATTPDAGLRAPLVPRRPPGDPAPPPTVPTTPPAGVDVQAAFARAYRLRLEALEEARDLDISPELRIEVDRLIEAERQLGEVGPKLVAANVARDPERIKEVRAGFLVLARDTEQQARRIGLKVCGRRPPGGREQREG